MLEDLDVDLDGAALLDELHDLLTDYVVLPSDAAADATTLWIAATHALPAFQHAPRLAIKSPEKRCGKSRLLDVIAGTCHTPLMTANATVAAIFRSLSDEHPPTLLIDEADTLFGTKKAADNNEDFRALLNAGHQRGRPAYRCVGPQQTVTPFPTFAMAALAGIGDLPDTITDRAINLTMRRRKPGETVASFRARQDTPRLHELRDRLAVWVGGRLEHLTDAQPDMPVEDRAADTWEPLVAIADAAGGDWPGRARAAALIMTGEADAADLERSQSTRLLADVKEVFDALVQVSFLPSHELLNRLQKMPDAPWADYGFTTTLLAARLREFDVRPRRNTTGDARGYRREDLDDAFARYLPVPPSEPVKPVRYGADLRVSSDGSKSSDTPTRQTRTTPSDQKRRSEPFLTDLTGSDGGTAAKDDTGCCDHDPRVGLHMPTCRKGVA